MLLVVAFVVCLALVPLTGGRVARLAELRLRGGWVMVASLGVAVAVTTAFPRGTRGLHVGLNLATYGGALAVLWLNRRLSGVWLVAVGTIANVVAIIANGGTMPASRHALATAGLPAATDKFVSSTSVVHPHLRWLGDVFASPRWIPFHNVFSVGDVLILAGACVLVLSATGSRLAGGRRPRGDQRDTIAYAGALPRDVLGPVPEAAPHAGT